MTYIPTRDEAYQHGFAAGSASRDADLKQAEQDYIAKCAELGLVNAELDALRKALDQEAKARENVSAMRAELAKDGDALRADAARMDWVVRSPWLDRHGVAKLAGIWAIEQMLSLRRQFLADPQFSPATPTHHNPKDQPHVA